MFTKTFAGIHPGASQCGVQKMVCWFVVVVVVFQNCRSLTPWDRQSVLRKTDPKWRPEELFAEVTQ